MNASDEYGHKWNFTKASDREQARKYVRDKKPNWLIGSPPCQNANMPVTDKIENEIHHDFCVELYEMQSAQNNYYIHEHALSNNSEMVYSFT